MTNFHSIKFKLTSLVLFLLAGLTELKIYEKKKLISRDPNSHQITVMLTITNTFDFKAKIIIKL